MALHGQAEHQRSKSLWTQSTEYTPRHEDDVLQVFNWLDLPRLHHSPPLGEVVPLVGHLHQVDEDLLQDPKTARHKEAIEGNPLWERLLHPPPRFLQGL